MATTGKPPNKHQNITVAVSYRLEAPEGERLEPARVMAGVVAIRNDGSQVKVAPKTKTVVDASGEVIFQIPGVQNLQELSTVQGWAYIQDGNKLDASATVPEDPKTAVLQGVHVSGFYEKSVPGQPGTYNLTATISLAASAKSKVIGTATLTHPAGPQKSFVILKDGDIGIVEFNNVSLKEGTSVVIVAELTENGIGTDNGTWLVERQYNQINSFSLSAEKSSEATSTQPASWNLTGNVTASLPYSNASGTWTLTSGASANGNLAFSRDMGAEDSFRTGPHFIKPGTTVEARATVEDDGKSHAMLAAASIEDDSQSQLTATLTGTPVDPQNKYGAYRLKVGFTAIIPSGDGASVSATGADGAQTNVSGYGTTAGHLDLGTTTISTPVTVSISGGNQVNLQWDHPKAPAIADEGQDSSEDDEADGQLTADHSAATGVGINESGLSGQDAGEDDDKKDDEKDKNQPQSIELVTPEDAVVGGTGYLLFQVTNTEGKPCVGRSIRWDFVEDGDAPHGWFGELEVEIMTAVTDAQGQFRTQYHCSKETASFGTNARFKEKVKFHSGDQEIGKIEFWTKPPLNFAIYKRFFQSHRESGFEYDPREFAQGQGVTIEPVATDPEIDGVTISEPGIKHCIVRLHGASIEQEDSTTVTIPKGFASGETKKIEIAVESGLLQRFTSIVSQYSSLLEKAKLGSDTRPVTEYVANQITQFQDATHDDLKKYENEIEKRIIGTSFFLGRSTTHLTVFDRAIRLNKESYERCRSTGLSLVTELAFYAPTYKLLGKNGVSEAAELAMKQLRDPIQEAALRQTTKELAKQAKTLTQVVQELVGKWTKIARELTELKNMKNSLDDFLRQLTPKKKRLRELVTKKSALEKTYAEAKDWIGQARAHLEKLKRTKKLSPEDIARHQRVINKEAKRRLGLVRQSREAIRQLDSEMDDLALRVGRLQRSVDESQRALRSRLRSQNAETVEALQEGLQTQQRELNKQIVEQTARRRIWDYWKQQLEALDAGRISKQDFLNQLEAIKSGADEHLRQFVASGPLSGVAGPIASPELSEEMTRYLAGSKFREAKDAVLSAQLMSQTSGEIAKILEAREKGMRDFVSQRPTSKRPYDDTEWDLSFGGLLNHGTNLVRRLWDGVISVVGSLVWAVDKLFAWLAEKAGIKWLYEGLFLMLRAILVFLVYICDVIIEFVQDASWVATQTPELYNREKPNLREDLKKIGGCPPEFFSLDVQDCVLSNTVGRLRDLVDQISKSGPKPTKEQAVAKIVNESDRDFETYRELQTSNANGTIVRLANRHLQDAVPELQGEPLEIEKYESEHLVSLYSNLNDYQVGFEAAKTGKYFWDGFWEAMPVSGKADTTFAHVDAMIDWLAWCIAWFLRFCALIGLVVGTTVTGPFGLVFGAAGLAIAEVVDVVGALIKMFIASALTETRVRGFQETLMLEQMRLFNHYNPKGTS